MGPPRLAFARPYCWAYHWCMVTRTSAVLAVLDAAAFQHGLVTGAQAAECGVSRPAVSRMVADGLLSRVRHGVYLLRGAGDLHDDLRAAWLQLDPARDPQAPVGEPVAVVSGESAAWVYGFGELMASRHEFTVAGGRRTRCADIVFHRAHLGEGEWQVVEGMAVTTPARMIADLAARQIDGGHLANVVGDALRSGELTAGEAAAALSGHSERYGIPDDGTGEQFLDYLLALTGSIAGAPLVVRGPPAGGDFLGMAKAHALASTLCVALAQAQGSAGPLRTAQLSALLQDSAAVTAALRALSTSVPA